jgi:hypothetical protein
MGSKSRKTCSPPRTCFPDTPACAADNATVCLNGLHRSEFQPFLAAPASRLVASYSVPRDSVLPPSRDWDWPAVGCLVRPQCVVVVDMTSRCPMLPRSPVSGDAPGDLPFPRPVLAHTVCSYRLPPGSGADLLPRTQLYQFIQVLLTYDTWLPASRKLSTKIEDLLHARRRRGRGDAS